jgi:release factor glutamine methyltransferase
LKPQIKPLSHAKRRFTLFSIKLYFCLVDSSNTLKSWYQKLSQALTPTYGPGEAQALARYLLCHYLDADWGHLLMQQHELLPPPLQQELETALPRLLGQEPVQYITGFAPFFGHEFKVAPGVLIPRPETEELVQWVLSDHKPSGRKLKVLDMGTGSGCIAISLALAWGAAAEVTGIDLSAEALQQASQNARRLGAKLGWLQQDILQATGEEFQELDVVVSNPPYIPEQDKREMAPNVLRHEPEMALFVPDESPLVFYEAIGKRALDWLRAGGYLYVEIHEAQGNTSRELFEGQGWEEVTLRKDLSGKDRMLRARKFQ